MKSVLLIPALALCVSLNTTSLLAENTPSSAAEKTETGASAEGAKKKHDRGAMQAERDAKLAKLLTPEELAQWKAADAKANADPAVKAAVEASKAATTKEEKMAARKELMAARQKAMLAADPTIQPVLDKIADSRKNDGASKDKNKGPAKEGEKPAGDE